MKSIMEEKYPGITFMPRHAAGRHGFPLLLRCLSPSHSVYRFTGLKSDSRKWGGAHQVNEHIACES